KDWVVHPAGYVPVDLTGQLKDGGQTLAGDVLLDVKSCGRFSVSRVRPDPADTGTGITGQWDDGHGTIYQIDPSGQAGNGQDSYTVNVIENAGYICLPINVEVTGTGAGPYTGPEAFYRGTPSQTAGVTGCGGFLGNGTITFNLSGDHNSLSVSWT